MISTLVHNKRTHIGKNIVLIAFALVLLLIGGILYLAFRSMSLRMFGWCEYIGIMDYINELRILCAGTHPSQFVLYNLPDLLWIVSYLLFVNALIPKTDRKLYLFWVLLMPILAILHEIMQALGILTGSFDLVDLLCYLIPTILNIIINLTH